MEFIQDGSSSKISFYKMVLVPRRSFYKMVLVPRVYTRWSFYKMVLVQDGVYTRWF